MRDLDALTRARKQHRVVAHNVATPNGGKTDGRRVTLTRHAFSRVNGTVFQITPQRTGNHLAHLQGCARGRVHLVTVMGFNDFNVIAGGQGLGRHLQQLERDVDAHAHIGGHHDGDVFGRCCDLSFLGVVE